MSELFKRSIRLTTILILITLILLIAINKSRWGFGIVVGALWSVINLSLTINIIEIAVLKRTSSKLRLYLLIKFPLLYLTGGLILIYRVFPVESLIVGLFSVFIAMGIVKLCPKTL